jgi:DNA repair photolyase
MTAQARAELLSQPTVVTADLRRGRGAVSNAASRYDAQSRVSFDDGWEGLGDLAAFKTEVTDAPARTIIARNDSPDISFDQSINPYRGCEHGCVYCYARPTHCYLGHSAGLDFETKLYAKPNAAERLEQELEHPNYVPKVIALGTNTDPYQPIERDRRITRSILEVLERTGHPAGIVTKSALVTRDIDILARMASRGLVKVALSVTTLDRHLARAMEPRASTPGKRLEALQQLSEAGCREAGYVLLRLPLELKEIFREWLAENAPDRADRVLHLLQSMHGGRDYTAEFGLRQKGSGPYAAQIAMRFRLALKRLGLNERRQVLRTDHFVRPILKGAQMSMF